MQSTSPAPEPAGTKDGFRKPRILPPVWLLLSLLAMYVLNRWMPLAESDGAWLAGLCWLLIVAALAIMLWATVLFLRARTGIVPFTESTALVTGGPYRHTRNPMYLGMALLLAGAAAGFGSLGALLPLPLFIAVIRQQFILNEERFLAAAHGEAFREYCRRVRRWL